MKNKYRMAMMIILIIMVVLYEKGLMGMSVETNFSLTLSALLLSIAAVFDTFAGERIWERIIRFCLGTFALGVALILPNLSDLNVVKQIMKDIDSNLLLLLALFFTFAGQWAMEIKIKDVVLNKGELNGEKAHNSK